MPTTITLEFMPDGNCSIAVRGGTSSRAEMSYRPQMPGRCAIPAVREEGPVSLTVILPPGAERPRTSEPPLSWSARDGRSYGTAQLASAPEYVDIMPADDRFPAIYGWGLIALAVIIVLWALGGRRRPRSVS